MSYSPLIGQLISALKRLPGVGQKSAQRMAFYLLQHDKQGAMQISQSLALAIELVGECSKCRVLSETELCEVCNNPKRSQQQVCVVESPSDVQAFEQSTHYDGRYFVLMGHLSPLDGIGPHEIGLDIFAKQLDAGEITEVILATNPTVEGEATAHYISEMTKKRNIKTTRIAHGVPIGGELEYVNGSTLSHALDGRSVVSVD
ncbi:Recombination protein RecR [hydrothermal vent metagenome]|uniref:Recombination protein RecR n=1 Tax=hydrothermal vent metagenome TaxID=652676 RepID=A0A3B1A1G0_9ZZZZ